MNPVGRPRAYKTPQELEAAIDLYFITIEEKGRPPTVSGLALALGFSSRQSIYDYQNIKEFTYTIKRAITRIEDYCETQLLKGGRCTGAIFWAKNHGWRDKQEIDFNNGGEQKDGFEFVDPPGKEKESSDV